MKKHVWVKNRKKPLTKRTPPPPLGSPEMAGIIRALKEDCPKGDLTSLCCIPANRDVSANLVAKSECVLAGWEYFLAVFRRVDPSIHITLFVSEGNTLKPGTLIAQLRGKARSILKGERVALNYLQRASGIATLTRKFVEALVPFNARILDTRKTTPGLRHLEKSAVRAGGGENHRWDLSDGFLIKENHISIAGGIREAVKKAKGYRRGRGPVRVEAETLEQVQSALEEGVDWILLDNMTVSQTMRAVRLVGGRCRLEVSGGINLKNVRSFAKTGVDFISVGALTHSAPAADLSLLVE